MQEETKIILSLMKRNYFIIFILPLIFSILIFFYIQYYKSNNLEYKRYNVFTNTSERFLTSTDKILHKFDNTNLAYNKPYKINISLINSLKDNEILIIGNSFRELVEILISDNQITQSLFINSLQINQLTPKQIFEKNFNRDDLQRLNIEFYSNETNLEIINDSISNAINYINLQYSNKINVNSNVIFSAIKKDIKLAIKTNDHIIETFSKQFDFINTHNKKFENDTADINLNEINNIDVSISKLNEITKKLEKFDWYEKLDNETKQKYASTIFSDKGRPKEMLDIELKLLFLNEYKTILQNLIIEINKKLSSSDTDHLKLVNDISKIEIIDDIRINFVMKYLYIISYFLFLILFLVFTVIYEYNFKRKN